MPRKRRLWAHLSYFLALLRRFYVTAGLGLVLFGLAPLVYWLRYRSPEGAHISYGEAFHHVYFLLYGQPSLPYVDNILIEALNLLIPPLGIAVVVDGVVRFAYLYFAKHKNDKEWIEVMSRTMKGHVVVAGAGRVGFRVASQLVELDKDVIVVEKREDAAFVNVLRDRGVPVLIDDIKSPHCLERTHMRQADALVCATDDDLVNMNAALDARKLNPSIRIVIRLFDDDLVARVREAFNAEAHSTSALAAPALALAALDPRIIHSFRVGPHLMVVSSFTAAGGLAALTIGDLSERFGGLTIAMKRGTEAERLHPKADTKIEPGDVLTVQLEHADYLTMRQFTGEQAPPVSVRH